MGFSKFGRSSSAQSGGGLLCCHLASVCCIREWQRRMRCGQERWLPKGQPQRQPQDKNPAQRHKGSTTLPGLPDQDPLQDARSTAGVSGAIGTG